jgi:hypothetical protein
VKISAKTLESPQRTPSFSSRHATSRRRSTGFIVFKLTTAIPLFTDDWYPICQELICKECGPSWTVAGCTSENAIPGEMRPRATAAFPANAPHVSDPPQGQNACRWEPPGVPVAETLVLAALLEHDRAAAGESLADLLSHRQDRTTGAAAGNPWKALLRGRVSRMRCRLSLSGRSLGKDPSV